MLSPFHWPVILAYVILALWINMVRRMDKWLTTMNHRIDEYRMLEQDWNGYDAPPFSDKVLSRTFDLVFAMRYSSNFCWFEEWELSPTGRGSIQIECSPDGFNIFKDKKKMYMEVEIYEDKYVIYCEDENWEKEFKSVDDVVEVMRRWTPKSIFKYARLRSLW